MTIQSATPTSPTRPDDVRPGERFVTQFSREQRGIMAAALVAFVGVALVGPAITRAATGARRMTHATKARVRRLGGGAIPPAKRAR
jgi:hypothetical protein